MTRGVDTGGITMQQYPGERITQVGQIGEVSRNYRSITLKELEDAKAQLLTRVESKHLMTSGQCTDLLKTLGDDYSVLQVNNSRISRYDTLYYDTNTFFTYIQHHNGKGNRYKLRVRRYESTGEIYLEVKKKNNKGATEKSRIRTTWPQEGFLPDQEEFLRSSFPYDYREFFPMVRTVYDRLTLVSNLFPERITFDTNISFRTVDGERSFPELVIAEIKFEKGVRNSPALLALHSMGIRKRGFSKYCIGVSLLYRWLKHNRFKPNLLFLSGLSSRGGIPC